MLPWVSAGTRLSRRGFWGRPLASGSGEGVLLSTLVPAAPVLSERKVSAANGRAVKHAGHSDVWRVPGTVGLTGGCAQGRS